jgi:hypothetical protein
MNATPFIPLNLPYQVSVLVPYYRGQQVFPVIGYRLSTDGFLSHTTLILSGRHHRTGQQRLVQKLEQQVRAYVSTDELTTIPHNGGLLQKLGIL